MTSTPATAPSSAPWRKITSAWALGFVALAFAGWMGERSEAYFGDGSRGRYFLQALIMSGLVVPGILWLRSRVDRLPLAGLGLPDLRRSLPAFALGLGIIAVPVIVTVLLTNLLGWGRVALNLSPSALVAFGAGIITVFFFEALPEEFLFRGYIYSTLNTSAPRWVAGGLTAALFVLLPILIVPFQQQVLGMEVRVGGASQLTASYLITMAIFAVFTQYLRILSGTVWMSMGFHFAFVLINRIMGPRPTAVIRFEEVTSQGPIQMTALVTILLLIVGLVGYPRFVKRPLGWKELVPAQSRTPV
jgi:membrane protease YdiL (CAAX protease family)